MDQQHLKRIEELENELKELKLNTPPNVAANSPPHLDWKAPMNQPSPYPDDMLSVDPKELPSIYKFMISAIVPRPIGFVSTVDLLGNVNLAPFSFFNMVSFDPPLLILSPTISGRSKKKKDTLNNMEATKECVVNIISDWFVESSNYCSGEFPPEVDEFTVSGLTKVKSLLVKPPRVQESAVQLECVVNHFHEVKTSSGKHSTTVAFAEVVKIHVNRAVYDAKTGTVDPTKLRPISRLGGITYAT